MAIEKRTDWIVDHKFDSKSCRHFNNGQVTVLHCHHYATLYCQLADDAEMVDGKSLLRRSSEHAFWPVLANYFEQHNIENLDKRVELAEEYFKTCGLGIMKFERVGEMSAVVRMSHSHVDEGWIKKWGQRDKPVNFIGQGFLAAAMAAIIGTDVGSFTVNEKQSIVSGADASVFTIVRI
jgi:predicted hydrocarbon binding protein